MDEFRYRRLRNAVVELLSALDEMQGELFERVPQREPNHDAPKITLKEAAQRYGVSESFLRKHKEIPHYRLGQNKRAPVRYDPRELDIIFEKHERNAS